MKNVTTMAAAKVAAVATGLAMATSMLSFAPMVHAAALTSTQIQSVLGLLTAFGADSATIANVNASLTGTAVTSGSTTTTTGTSACTFTANLTIGSTGMAVTCLQNALIAGGFTIPAGATGYFGSQTRTAVASWQSSKNIAPAVGYFGAISRAAFNLGSTTTTTGTTTTTTTTTTSTVAGCAAGAVFSATTGQACSGTTVTTGALTGTGRLTNVSSLSDTTSDLKEGDSATQVAGFSATATGGDVAVQRVDVHFVIANGSGSSNLNQYVSDVSLYLDGKKLASMDPALGDKTGSTWDLRFSGLNGVIKSGTTGDFYVKVTPVSSVNSANTGITTVTFVDNGIRAVGADGISDTYTTSATGTFTVTAATAGTLTVTPANDNPVASQITTSSSTVSGVKLLSFNMKAKNSDVTVTDIGAGIAVTGGNTVNAIISNVKLMKGSTTVKSGTVTGGTSTSYASVVFSGVNQTIAKDATGNYWISVDLKNDGGYVDGSTILASTTQSTGWDVTDANGDTVTPSAATSGSLQTLTGVGISVVKGTITQSILANSGAATIDDVGSYVIPFTVTAGDNDIYVSGAAKDLAAGGTATANILFATTTTSDVNKTGQPSANLSAAGVVTGDLAGSYYKILAGNSRTFTLSVTYTGSTATGWTGLQLSSIAYGSSSSLGKSYTSGLDTFKTTDLNLVNRP